MPQVQLNVKLLRHTLSPEEVVALGAKLCYSKSRVDDLTRRVEAADQTAFVEKIMGMGHESVLEHASFTFGVEGVSRVLLAQITRHRLASFSVQSQRYVSYAGALATSFRPKWRPWARRPWPNISAKWTPSTPGIGAGRKSWAQARAAMRTLALFSRELAKPGSCSP